MKPLFPLISDLRSMCCRQYLYQPPSSPVRPATRTFFKITDLDVLRFLFHNPFLSRSFLTLTYRYIPHSPFPPLLLPSNSPLSTFPPPSPPLKPWTNTPRPSPPASPPPRPLPPSLPPSLSPPKSKTQPAVRGTNWLRREERPGRLGSGRRISSLLVSEEWEQSFAVLSQPYPVSSRCTAIAL